MAIRYVHTKGKTACECYMSNLQMLPEPLVYKGKRYPSIEHAFQAAKYDFTDALVGAKQSPAEVKTWFEVGHQYGELPATEAVSKGKKGNMTKLKLALRIAEWNRRSVPVMRELMKARAQVDPAFVACLVEASKRGIPIFHREKGGDKAVWGGTFVKGTKDRDRSKETFIGQNMMGKLLEEVGDDLAKHQSLDSLLGKLPIENDCSFKPSAAAARRVARGLAPRKTSKSHTSRRRASRKSTTSRTSRRRASRKSTTFRTSRKPKSTTRASKRSRPMIKQSRK